MKRSLKAPCLPADCSEQPGYSSAITPRDLFVKHFSKLTLLSLSLSLAACTVLDSDKINYKSAGKVPSLGGPPALPQLSRDPLYAVPGGPVSASTFQIGKASQSA